jgi:predicted pyridoxine 5'-phosphate oxidase superfamily flavin-nucleotide-binding protein
VLDDRHLAIPDMAGNNRLDSLQNIVFCPAVSVLFLVPGVGETLRVVGDAVVTRDEAVLEACRVGELLPNVAIVVEMRTATSTVRRRSAEAGSGRREGGPTSRTWRRRPA